MNKHMYDKSKTHKHTVNTTYVTQGATDKIVCFGKLKETRGKLRKRCRAGGGLRGMGGG